MVQLIINHFIFLLLALPLLAALVAGLLASRPNLRDSLLVFIAVVTAITAWCGYIYGVIGQEWQLAALTKTLSVGFAIERFGMVFILIVASLWWVTMLYTIGYMRGNKEAHQGRFYVFFSLSIFAALAIAMSENLLTLFMFYEALTLLTYPLVTHQGSDAAKKGGRLYLTVLMGSSLVFFLPALVITYQLVGDLSFVPKGLLRDVLDPPMLLLLLFLFVFGIGKAALMPFHRWLPAAMVAPTPVSALLHAVAVVKAGIFSVIKVVVFIFGLESFSVLSDYANGFADWFLYAACFTILAASITALRQDSLKKRLAYSTISQLSYMLVAISLFTPAGIIAASFHMVAHAFGKITLFFTAGAIYTASGKRDISQFNGIGKRMPLTMTCFTLAALSMIAVPPLAGFVSKWLIMDAAFADKAWLVVATLLVSTLLNAAYFLPISYHSFFSAEDVTLRDHKEAPGLILVALVLTALASLALFFCADAVLAVIKGVSS